MRLKGGGGGRMIMMLYYVGLCILLDDCMMGMSPNMTMYDLCVYDMIGCARVFYVFNYFNTCCGTVALWGNANTRLQGISLKVPEHDVELNRLR